MLEPCRLEAHRVHRRSACQRSTVHRDHHRMRQGLHLPWPFADSCGRFRANSLWFGESKGVNARLSPEPRGGERRGVGGGAPDGMIPLSHALTHSKLRRAQIILGHLPPLGPASKETGPIPENSQLREQSEQAFRINLNGESGGSNPGTHTGVRGPCHSCLRSRKSAAVGLPLAAVLAEVFAALIFKRLNGAVLAHGVGLRQIMDELLERNRAAVLGKVVGLERLADERR